MNMNAEQYFELIAGAIFFPIGIFHGFYLWVA